MKLDAANQPASYCTMTLTWKFVYQGHNL